jgi:hypothetical protein
LFSQKAYTWWYMNIYRLFDIWAAVDVMRDLFHTLAVAVAEHFGFTYRQDGEDGIRGYLGW